MLKAVKKLAVFTLGVLLTASIIIMFVILGMRANAQWYAEDKAKMLEVKSGYTVDYDVIETSFGHYKVVRSGYSG